MNMKNRTKLMFAYELEAMLETKTLDSVRVVDLCERCGASPQTFYYHFHDKYELIAWIFLWDFADTFADKSPDYSPKMLEQFLLRLESRKNFYKKAFGESTQNSIYEYILQFNIMMSKTVVESYKGKITEAEIIQLKYHNYGVLGMFEEWINGKIDIPISDFSLFFYEKTPDFLRQAYAEYPYSKSTLLTFSSN